MSDKKIAIVDTDAWHGAELYSELQRRGWTVSRCQGALRSVYLPKLKESLLIATLHPERIASMIERHQQVIAKGERSGMMIALEPNFDFEKLKDGMRQCHDEACPIEGAVDLADFIEYRMTATERITPFTAKCNLGEIVKLMTWRIEGLPKEYVETVTKKYQKLEMIIQAAQASSTEAVGKTDILQLALQEIKLFLERDYYLE